MSNYVSNKKTKFGRTLDTDWHNMWQEDNLGSTITGLVGGLGNALGTGITTSQIQDTDNIEAEYNAIGNTQFSTGSYDNLLAQFDVNNMANTNLSKEDLMLYTPGQQVGNVLLAGVNGFLGSNLGANGGKLNKFAGGGLISGLFNSGLNMVSAGIGSIVANNKAKKEANRLNLLAEEVNQQYLNNFNNAVSNTQNTMFNNSLLNIASYGGPLFDLSGEFSNGLTFIDEGGPHELNPFGGVMVGVDQEGTPNLVEEGEIIYNDYVFSNRLKPTKKQLADGGFTEKYNDWTFAEIVEDLQKESSERPNDIISKAGLDNMMSRVMMMQEEIRGKKNNTNNKFPYGGLIYDDLNLNFKPTTFVPKHVKIPKLTYELGIPKEQSVDMFDATKPKTLAEQIVAKAFEETVPVPKLDYTKKFSKESRNTQTSESLPWQSGLRYASPALHGILLANNLQKPDYSDEKALMRKASSMTRGSHTPLGTILDLDLVDRNVYTNPILANAAANRRAIQQGLTDPRAALLANNYITNNALGMADIQGTQANNATKAQKAQFDLTRDQANAELALRDLAMDQQADQVGLNVMANAIQSMNAKNAMRNQAIGAEASGLADDFGAISREASDRYLMDKLIGSRALQWVKAKNGGMLTRKRRRK